MLEMVVSTEEIVSMQLLAQALVHGRNFRNDPYWTLEVKDHVLFLYPKHLAWCQAYNGCWIDASE